MHVVLSNKTHHRSVLTPAILVFSTGLLRLGRYTCDGQLCDVATSVAVVVSAQFAEAGLNPWNNRWSEIHDFSSRGGVSGNWGYLDGKTEFDGTVMPAFPPDLVEELSIVDEAAKWRLASGGSDNPPLVPYSVGCARSTMGEVRISNTRRALCHENMRHAVVFIMFADPVCVSCGQPPGCSRRNCSRTHLRCSE
jgi:hypothetical protein